MADDRVQTTAPIQVEADQLRMQLNVYDESLTLTTFKKGGPARVRLV